MILFQTTVIDATFTSRDKILEDINGPQGIPDGIIDIEDITKFVDLYLTQQYQPLIDFNNDLKVDSNDVTYLVDAYNSFYINTINKIKATILKPEVDGTHLTYGGIPLNIYGFNIRDNFAESDIKWIADHGYNAIRLVILWETIERTEDTYSWSRIDNTLAWCNKYGLWVWMDVHQWEYSSYFQWDEIGTGCGFPAWLVQKGGYQNSESGQTSFSDDFFLKRGSGATTWGEFTEFWVELLTHCKSRSYFERIICWEMLNEPTVGAWHSSMAKNAINDRYTEWISLVREIDSDTIICLHHIETGYNRKQNVDNIIWTKSAYAEYGAGTTLNNLTNYFTNRKIEFNEGMGVPYVVSETGMLPNKSEEEITIFFTRFFNAQKTILGDGQCCWFIWRYDTAYSSGGYLPPRTDSGADSKLQHVLNNLM